MSEPEVLSLNDSLRTSRGPAPPPSFRTTAVRDWNFAKAVLPEGVNLPDWEEWWKSTPWHQTYPKKNIQWSTAKKSSDIWQHYQACARSTDGKPFIQCIRCTITLAHPAVGNTGTSALSRHLQSKGCIREAKRKGLGSIRDFLQDEKTAKRTEYIQSIGAFTTENFITQTLRMLSSLNLSFRSLDHVEFQRWIEFVRRAPKSTEVRVLPSRRIRSYLTEHIYTARVSILEQIPRHAKVAIALDCWTSPNHHSFLAITGYFIDAEWNYQEVLLGFEHVTGAHTGQKLAEIVQVVLQDCNIDLQRIITMTTDNASNNKTLAQALSNAINIFKEDCTHNGITRLPCLAHVIQLTCREILVGIKIQAKNDKVITVWDDDELNREQHTPLTREPGAPITLKKLRDTIIFINASTGRRDDFHAIQSRRRPLNLVQDVATRWNSTLKMMLRARRLKTDVALYIERFPSRHLSLFSQTEWQHIDYLIEILYPFYQYTNAVGRVQNGPTIHNVYAIYNKLFTHVENYIQILSRKRILWKRQIHDSLEAAESKLRKYYSETQDTLGEIYAIATILSPRWKLSLFETEEWGGDENWVEQYHQLLQDTYREYQAKHAPGSIAECPDLQPSSTRSTPPISSDGIPSSPPREPRRRPKRKATDDLHSLLSEGSRRPRVIQRGSEIQRYLHDKENFGIDFEDQSINHTLRFWKRAATRKGYPILAAMARDYLAIPAAGVGVERLFNTARDICSYRRYRLQPETIRTLMMTTCASKFDRDNAYREHESDSERSDTSEDEEDYGDEQDSDGDIEDDIEQVVDLISDEEEDSEHEDQDTTQSPVGTGVATPRLRERVSIPSTPTPMGLVKSNRRRFLPDRGAKKERIVIRLQRGDV